MITASSNEEWLKNNQEATRAFRQIATRYYQRFLAESVRPGEIEALLELHNNYVDAMKKWVAIRNSDITARDTYLRNALSRPTLNVGSALITHRNAVIALGTEIKALLDSKGDDTQTVDADGKITFTPFVFTPVNLANIRTRMLNVGSTMITD